MDIHQHWIPLTPVEWIPEISCSTTVISCCGTQQPLGWQTCELPHIESISHFFPLRYTTTRILSALYIHLLNMEYTLYPVGTEVSDFAAVAYQVEIILRLATKHEIRWYARNMAELQPLNRTIRFMGPTWRIIAHQATSWTHQLYKDKNTHATAQHLHHPHPTTPLAATTTIDTMKICPFYETTHEHHQLHLNGDSIHIHIHIHYLNTQFQQTRDTSNNDIAITLSQQGSFFQHAPYRQPGGHDSVLDFFSTPFHQYDDNTQHDTNRINPNVQHLYQHTTLEPPNHRRIISTASDWDILRPTMTPNSTYCLTY